ncbi:MAG TPA: hypothetical protein VKY73_01035 [Polyangiaceae bacterium]|nr:hypothetical protein [Polyangiaceae bacterium]
MRGRGAWAALAVVSIALSVGAQSARPRDTTKAAPPAAAAPAPVAPEATGEAATDDPSAPGAPPGDAPAPAASDLGEAPPAAESAGPQKLSPLTPRPEELPLAPKPPPPTEFDRLLTDIAALRGRVAALTTTLFKSRLRVIVETRGDSARLDALSVTLDDGVVFSAPPRFNAEDERVVYEHAVAPGEHVLGLDAELYDLRGQRYRSWQSARFVVLVPESRLLEAHFVLRDDSEMAVDFPDGEDGEYDVRVELRARVAE